MASLLKSLLDDPHIRKDIQTNVRIFLESKKGRSLDWLLNSIYTIDNGAEPQENSQSGHTEEDRQALLESAVDLFLTLLLRKNGLDAMLAHSQRAVRQGTMLPEDAWKKLCEKGWMLLKSYLQDEMRKLVPAKKAYRSIRDCLSKARQELRLKHFFNGIGTFSAYAPARIPVEDAVAPSSYDFGKVPEPDDDAPGIAPKDKFFNQAFLVPQAKKFWHAYTTAYGDGRARYIFVDTFCHWLNTKHGIYGPRQQDLYDEDGEIDRDIDVSSLYDDSMESTLIRKEMQAQVNDFIRTLPEKTVIFCALRYAEDQEPKDVALIMGYSHTSGLSRIQKDLHHRLADFMTNNVHLLDNESKTQCFFRELWGACENRYAMMRPGNATTSSCSPADVQKSDLSPNKKAGG